MIFFTTWFNQLFSMLCKCFYLLFKCFTNTSIGKLILFCDLTLIRRSYFLRERYSYLSVLPDNNAEIFTVSLLIFYCCFSSPTLSPVARISFYILSERFFLKHKELLDAKVVSVTKKEYGFAVHFLKRFINTIKSVSDELLSTICWKTSLFRIFVRK